MFIDYSKNKEHNPYQPNKICRHSGHNPPNHIYIPPGTTHTHTCPHCGQTQHIHVPVVTC